MNHHNAGSRMHLSLQLQLPFQDQSDCNRLQETVTFGPVTMTSSIYWPANIIINQ
jgi:hypothetical protein